MLIKSFNNLKRFIGNKFHSDIHAEIENFVQDHFSDTEFDPIDLEVENVEVKKSKIVDLVVINVTEGDLVLDSKVEARIILSGKSLDSEKLGKQDKTSIRAFFNVSMNVEISETADNIFITYIEPMGKEDSLIHSGLDSHDFLLKIDTPEEADFYAEMLLAKYYPDVLKKPMALPVTQLIENMGLNLQEKKLESGVYAKCYLADEYRHTKSGRELATQRGTIVYKDEKSDVGRRRRNFSLAHECAHWFCNNEYFARMGLINPKFTVVNCAVDGNISYASCYAEDVAIMEKQANSLAPRMLMPRETARYKFSEIVDRNVINELDIRKVYEISIKEFADFFDVSISAAKIRLLELGFRDIKGIYDYVDGHYTKPYLYDISRVKPNEVFSVSTADAVRLSFEDEELKKLIETGKIAFVDNHFVINSPKYITGIKGTGKPSLTNYALTHMDECCLVFKCNKDKNVERSKEYALAFLNRSESDEPKKTFSFCSPVNKSIKEETSELADAFLDMDEAFIQIQAMNDTFVEAVKYLLENREDGEPLSCRAASRETNVNVHKFAKAVNGEDVNFTKQEVVAICLGLHLNIRVSYHLLELAGYNIMGTKSRQDWAYLFLLTYKNQEELKDINFWLVESGHPDWQLP